MLASDDGLADDDALPAADVKATRLEAAPPADEPAAGANVSENYTNAVYIYNEHSVALYPR
jgi:hypothetical protein